MYNSCIDTRILWIHYTQLCFLKRKKHTQKYLFLGCYHQKRHVSFSDTLDAARKGALDSDCTSGEDEKGRGHRRKKKPLKITSESEGESSSGKENSPPPSLCLDNIETQRPLSPYNSENTPRSSLGLHCRESVARISTTTCDNTENTPRLSQGLHCRETVARNSTTTCDNTGNILEIYQHKSLREKTDNKEVQELTAQMDYLIKINKKILMYVKEIESKLDKNESKEKKISNEFKSIQNKLPVQSIEKLQEIDLIIKDNDDLKENFVNYIKCIGGRSTKEMISRIMIKVMTNSVGISCSLLGKRNHVAFKNLTIMNLIISAVQQVFSDATESSIELAVAEWLRLSKLRQSREKP